MVFRKPVRVSLIILLRSFLIAQIARSEVTPLDQCRLGLFESRNLEVLMLASSS